MQTSEKKLRARGSAFVILTTVSQKAVVGSHPISGNWSMESRVTVELSDYRSKIDYRVASVNLRGPVLESGASRQPENVRLLCENNVPRLTKGIQSEKMYKKAAPLRWKLIRWCECARQLFEIEPQSTEASTLSLEVNSLEQLFETVGPNQPSIHRGAFPNKRPCGLSIVFYRQDAGTGRAPAEKRSKTSDSLALGGRAVPPPLYS